MRLLFKVVVLVVVSLMAMQPLAACFSSEMSVSEEQCCQEMQGDCSYVSMPTAHSCCTYVDSSAVARLEARKTLETTDLSAALPRTPALISASPQLLAFAQTTPVSPPQSPPLSIQVLRI